MAKDIIILHVLLNVYLNYCFKTFRNYACQAN